MWANSGIGNVAGTLHGDPAKGSTGLEPGNSQIRPFRVSRAALEPRFRRDGGSRLNPDKEFSDGGNNASNAGSGGAFRPPDPLLEPEDGGLYLRPAQQDSHR